MNTQSNFSLKQWIQSPTGFVVLGLAAFAAIYLITEHTSHVLSLLPYVLLLLCPLLHFFMMRGMHQQHIHKPDDHRGHKPE